MKLYSFKTTFVWFILEPSCTRRAAVEKKNDAHEYEDKVSLCCLYKTPWKQRQKNN